MMTKVDLDLFYSKVKFAYFAYSRSRFQVSVYRTIGSLVAYIPIRGHWADIGKSRQVQATALFELHHHKICLRYFQPGLT